VRYRQKKGGSRMLFPEGKSLCLHGQSPKVFIIYAHFKRVETFAREKFSNIEFRNKRLYK
jgi:hypothetical protein